MRSGSRKRNRNNKRKHYNGGDASNHAIKVYGGIDQQNAGVGNSIAVNQNPGQLPTTKFSGGNLLPTVQNIAVPAVLLGTNQLYKNYSKGSSFKGLPNQSRRRRNSKRFRRRSFQRR